LERYVTGSLVSSMPQQNTSCITSRILEPNIITVSKVSAVSLQQLPLVTSCTSKHNTDMFIGVPEHGSGQPAGSEPDPDSKHLGGAD